MNLVDITIEDLLPHRDTMLLIDEIIEIDDKKAVTASTVTKQWPFFDGQAVNPLVLIELVAQTAGIANGWLRIKKRGKDSNKKGWLVGVKQSRFWVEALSLKTRIITHAENQFEYESYREILGKANIGADIAAEVMVQLIQTDSD